MSESRRLRARIASIGVLPAATRRSVVGAALGGAAELDDSHDVQHAVDLAVACPGQAVADLVAGGRVDRRGGTT